MALRRAKGIPLTMSAGLIVLVITIASLVFAVFTEISFFKDGKIAKVTKVVAVALTILSIPANIWDYTQSQIDQDNQFQKIENLNLLVSAHEKLVTSLREENFELRKRIELFDKENSLLKLKVHEMENRISSLSIRYTVLFSQNTDQKLYADGLLIGPDSIYAYFNNRINFSSSGVSFRFLQLAPRFIQFTCEASVSNGSFPLGEEISIFKDTQQLSLHIPLLRAPNNLSEAEKIMVVHNYSIDLIMNGKRKAQFNNNKPFKTFLTRGIYSNSDSLWLQVHHTFKDSLFSTMKQTNK